MSVAEPEKLIVSPTLQSVPVAGAEIVAVGGVLAAPCVVAEAMFEYPLRFGVGAPSWARTRYRYVVAGWRPVLLKELVGGVPTSTKLVQLAPWQRSTRYSGTPEGSVEAVQPRLIWVWLTAVATRLVGVVGGPVSGGGAPPTGVFMSAWIWAA